MGQPYKMKGYSYPGKTPLLKDNKNSAFRKGDTPGKNLFSMMRGKKKNKQADADTVNRAQAQVAMAGAEGPNIGGSRMATVERNAKKKSLHAEKSDQAMSLLGGGMGGQKRFRKGQ